MSFREPCRASISSAGRPGTFIGLRLTDASC